MMRGSHMHPPRVVRGDGRWIIDKAKPAAADFQAEIENLVFYAIGWSAKGTLGVSFLRELVEQLTQSPWDQAKPP